MTRLRLCAHRVKWLLRWLATQRDRFLVDSYLTDVYNVHHAAALETGRSMIPVVTLPFRCLCSSGTFFFVLCELNHIM